MGREFTIKSWGMRLHGVRPRRWLPHGSVCFTIVYGHLRFRLTAKFRRGMCVTERTQMSAVNPAVELGCVKWEWPDMRKKQSKTEVGDARHLAAVETTRFTDLMSLVEHCAIRKYDDGDVREPGWITIKTQGAAWCVQVKDPDACVSFTAIGDTIDKAIETAALLLSCDEAPWEPDAFLSQSKARRKK